MLLEARTKQQSAHDEVKLLQTLNVSQTPEGLSFALKVVCEFGGWDYGEAWIPCLEETVLELTSEWYISTSVDSSTVTALEMFRLVSDGFVMPPNVGLPGRVWATKTPEWIPNVSAESEAYFLRNKIARACGVTTGFGIPLISDRQVWAVLAFFRTV